MKAIAFKKKRRQLWPEIASRFAPNLFFLRIPYSVLTIHPLLSLNMSEM